MVDVSVCQFCETAGGGYLAANRGRIEAPIAASCDGAHRGGLEAPRDMVYLEHAENLLEAYAERDARDLVEALDVEELDEAA